MPKLPKISVIMPAHNEEKYIARCIESIRGAQELYDGEVEIVVSCNRCTDNTQKIAESLGAVTVTNDYRCIAHVRNDAIRASSGDIIVTIDSDNMMTPGTLCEIYELLTNGNCIGGGSPMFFERKSLTLRIFEHMLTMSFRMTGIWCGIFWGTREAFFSAELFPDIKVGEDIAFAKAMRKYAKSQGKKYGHLRKNHLINNTRKFDRYGDWLYVKLMVKSIGLFFLRLFGKKDAFDKMFDEIFYDYNGK